MLEGDGFEKWEYVGAKSLVAAFSRENIGSLYKRELPPVLDLVFHGIESNVFQLGHKAQRRDDFLKAYNCIHRGIWYSPQPFSLRP